MKTKLNLLLLAVVLCFSRAQFASAQAPGSGPAAEMIAQRQKNDALMKQYSWNCRTEILINAQVKDTRIELVNFGPTGQIQRSLLNDQQCPLPYGFWARQLAQDVRQQVEQGLQGLRGLLDQYTLPGNGKIIQFIGSATIQAPDANGQLQLSGGSVIQPGDTLSLWVNAPQKQLTRLKIMTYYNVYEVTVTATYKTSVSGLNYMAFAQVDCPALSLSIQLQNFDYENQNF